ncbi:MAG: glycosidase [Arenicella sp.]|jgi:glycosidase
MNHKLTIYQILTRLFGNKNSTNQFNGSIEENGVGKFKNITPKALKEIKKLGISHVWFTGIFEHASQTDYTEFGIKPDHPSMMKGRAGSPYAIKDYYDVAPDLAVDVSNRMTEFESLIQRTHKTGLKAIIDFIPNHLARSYKSDNKLDGVQDFGESDDETVHFAPDNNFYYFPKQPLFLLNPDKNSDTFRESPAKATGNDVFHNHPSENDWYETVKLNYGLDYSDGKKKHFSPIPKTWEMMRDILLFWAEKGVDGFRCDMAEMVPVEFWAWVTDEVKSKFPNVLFIAEIYNPALYHNFIEQGGFDYLYDKVDLYDTLRAVVEEKGSANGITNCWQKQEGITHNMLRFLENHDEQRIASGFFSIDAYSAIPAMVVSATLNKGPVMIYFGQEVGEPAKDAQGFSGEDGRTSIFDYCGVPAHQSWMNGGKFDGKKLENWQKTLREKYSKLLNLCLQKEAIQHGEFYDLQYLNFHSPNYNSNKIYSYIRHTPNQKLLIVCNFDRHNEYSFRLKLSEHVFDTVGLSKSGNLKGIEIYNEKEESFEIQPNQAMNEGIDLRILPIQALIFELK